MAGLMWGPLICVENLGKTQGGNQREWLELKTLDVSIQQSVQPHLQPSKFGETNFR